MIYIEFKNGVRREKTVAIEDNKTMVFGRDSSSDVSIIDNTVSRRHVMILWKDGAPYIRDLESRNGTLLNGIKIDADTKIQEGDIIQLARSIELYVHESDPEENFRSVIRCDNPRDFFSENSSKDNTIQMLRDLNTLYEIGNLISAEQEMNSLLRKIGDVVASVISPDRLVILLKDPDSDELISIPVTVENSRIDANAPISNTIVNKSMKERVAVLTEDALTDDRFDQGESIWQVVSDQ